MQNASFTARARPAVIAAALVAALGSCRNPRVDANIAQAMIDVGNNMAAVQQDVANLQAQVDSLRQVAARQDTIIQRLAALTGLPLPSR